MEKFSGISLLQKKQVEFAHWCLSFNKQINENADLPSLIEEFNAFKLNNTPQTTIKKPTILRRKKKEDVPPIISTSTQINTVENNTSTFVINVAKLNTPTLKMDDVKDAILTELKDIPVKKFELLFVNLENINGIDYYKDDNNVYYDIKNLNVAFPLSHVIMDTPATINNQSSKGKISRYFQKK